jgi:hypothetical protein
MDEKVKLDEKRGSKKIIAKIRILFANWQYFTSKKNIGIHTLPLGLLYL